MHPLLADNRNMPFGLSEQYVLLFISAALAAPLLWNYWRQRHGSDLVSEPTPPTNTMITICVIACYLIALAIIAVSLLEGGSYELSDVRYAGKKIPLITQELLMSFVISVWITLPIATTAKRIVLQMASVSTQLLIVLCLLVYKTTAFFWLTAILLVIIVINELGHRFDDEPMLKKLAQTVMVFGLFTTALLVFTIIFLPSLASDLYNQFDYVTLFRIRTLVFVFFVTVIVLATVIKTVETFRFQWKKFVYTEIDNVNKHGSLVGSAMLPFHMAGQFLRVAIQFSGNLSANFFRLIGTFFATVLVEALRFIWQAFLSWPLWRAILYIAGTAFCLFTLAGEVILVKPHLATVLSNTTLFAHLDDRSLVWSNALIGFHFVVAVAAILSLVQIRMPRKALPALRQSAVATVVIAAASVYICAVLATITYFPVLNYIFTLHSWGLNWPGVYTTIAVLLAVLFATAYRQSGVSESQAGLKRR